VSAIGSKRRARDDGTLAPARDHVALSTKCGQLPKPWPSRSELNLRSGRYESHLGGCQWYTATADPFQRSGGDQSKSRIATGDRLAVARVLETKYIVVMKGLGATEHLVV
jgi:hypothetical protein